MSIRPEDVKAEEMDEWSETPVALANDENDADRQALDTIRSQRTKAGKSVCNVFFKDGQRRIDFVLAWSADIDKDTQKAEEARLLFEKNLRLDGLQLEYDKKGSETHFVKVHAPYEVLMRYADILKIRLPMKDSPELVIPTDFWTAADGCFKKFMLPFQVDRTALPLLKQKLTCPYAEGKEYLFDIPKDKSVLFSPATRSWIVDYILRRKRFAEDSQKANSFGVNKMIADDYYNAAYPLHDGHWEPGSADNERKLLYNYWSCWKNFMKFQPLDHVRYYFGEKIGLYFAWLEFYVLMLIPPSIIGLFVFIYGLTIMNTNTYSKEVCNHDSNIIMCPLCGVHCPFWKLGQSCGYVSASRIFDNGATVFFAIFMSLWGTLFLEFWKRKEASIQYQWDLTNFVLHEEPLRPEYLSMLENWQIMKTNPITGLLEPHLPFWYHRFPILLGSYSAMVFLISIAIMSVGGVIAYRVSVSAALQMTEDTVATSTASVAQNLVVKNASLFTTITAAFINLVIILILNYVYKYIAFWLTDWECLRTQSEFDKSINIKLFLLQFVNYYSSIFYIAFFKGRFVGYPGKYKTIFGARPEECQEGGCLIELCIQMAIIMVGKQLIQNLTEILLPKLIMLKKEKCSKQTTEQKQACTSYENDFNLEPTKENFLFYEYLEMVLQFGFLTIFSAAFPLAPLFALFNNVMEIRVDASKFITHLRRPVAERVADIGVWYSVLYAITRLAIVSNAFIIALTSDFIPRLVYQLNYSSDQTMTGYVQFSLSYFNTSDFDPQHQPKPDLRGDIKICRYRDFRNPPGHTDQYEYSDVFWHVLAARLAFVVVFENLVVAVTSLIAWLIPDVPLFLKEKIRREAYITTEITLRNALQQAQCTSLKGLEDETFEIELDDVAEQGSAMYSSDSNNSSV